MQLARDREVLERVSVLAEGRNRDFELLKGEALKKLERVERSLTRLLFTTAVEVDPKRVEYDRGFRQGVMYVIEGLPNEIAAEFRRELGKTKEA